MGDTLRDYLTPVFIGKSPLCNQRFADEYLTAGSNSNLEKPTNSQTVWMEISTDKSEVIVNFLGHGKAENVVSGGQSSRYTRYNF